MLNFKTALFKVMLGCFIIGSISNASAQKTEYLRYTFTPDERIESLVNKALKKKIDAFYNEFQYVPFLEFATADLNGDKKPEIIARFTEEMDYIDAQGNVDTHIFAYTKKGLIQILEVPAMDVALGKKDASGLREIIAFKGVRRSRYEVFKWDGKRRYIKK